jgi:hypothetical protein
VSTEKSALVLNGIGQAPAGCSLGKTSAGTLVVPVAPRYSYDQGPGAWVPDLLYRIRIELPNHGWISISRVTRNA